MLHDIILAIERYCFDFQLSEAEVLLESLPSAESHDEVSMILRGYLQLARGDFLKAAVLFNKCTSPLSKYYLAISYYSKACYSQCISVLDEITTPKLEIDVILPGSLIFQTLSLHCVNRLKLAAMAQMFDGLPSDIKTENLDSREPLAKKAKAHQVTSDETLVTVNPHYESIQAVQLFRSRKYFESLGIPDLAIQCYPNILWNLNDLDELERLFIIWDNDILTKDLAILVLGNIRSLNGDHEEAIQVFMSLVKLYPDFLEAYISAGSEYLIVGDVDSADQIFSLAVERNKLCGEALYRKGDYDDAISNLNAALKIRPSDFLIHVYKASALVKKGYPKEAMVSIDQALKLDSRNLKAIYLKATILIQLEKVLFQHQDALKYVKQLHSLAPNEIDPLIKAGDLLYKLGRSADARAYYSRALDMHPLDSTVIDRLGSFR